MHYDVKVGDLLVGLNLTLLDRILLVEKEMLSPVRMKKKTKIFLIRPTITGVNWMWRQKDRRSHRGDLLSATWTGRE